MLQKETKKSQAHTTDRKKKFMNLNVAKSNITDACDKKKQKKTNN